MLEGLRKIKFSLDEPSLYGINASNYLNRENDQIRASLLSSALRVDKELLPEIADVIKSVEHDLAIDFQAESYIYNDPRPNASCIDSGTSKRVLILLSSGLIQLLEPLELKFVIGHEVGHYIFNHHSYPNPETEENKYTQLNIYELQRSAEISADRVGFVCINSLEAVFKTILKVSTGLPEKFFRIDFASYIQQLRDLNTLGGNLEGIEQTHPIQHVRLKSLLLFSMTAEFYDLMSISKSSPMHLAQVDKRIQRDLSSSSGSLLDEIRNSAFQKAELWTILHIAFADNKLTKSDQNLIKSYFNDDIAYKAIEFARSHGPNGVQRKFEESIKSIRNQPEDYKIAFKRSVGNFMADLEDKGEEAELYSKIINSRLYE